MNYYPFHLGDYAAHTAHLEPLEDLAYRRMLDAYYLREMPLPADPAEVARLVRMRQNVAEVEAVLREFFALTADGWRHARCDEEIDRMQDRQAKARASAAASVNARRANASRTAPANVEHLPDDRSTPVERTLNDRSTDVELPTPTPTPNSVPDGTQTRVPRASSKVERPHDVPESVWADFVAHRKARKATLTATALAGIEREAAKARITLAQALAMCCTRGWTGFRAEWVGDSRAAAPGGRASRLEQSQAWASQFTGRAAPSDADTVDVAAVEVVQ